jgi:hypothetical protein
MKHLIMTIIGLLPACSACLADAGAGNNAFRGQGNITIDNGIVSVCCYVEDGTFSVRHRNKLFIKRGCMQKVTHENTPAAWVVTKKGNLGTGSAIEVKFSSGYTYTLALYSNMPFLFTKSNIHNVTDKTIIVNRMTAVSLDTDLGKPAKDLRVLGCDGLTTAEQDRISYTFLALAEPKRRSGVVAGWLTNDKTSGIVLSKSNKSSVTIEGRSEYGNLRIEPGDNADGETFAVGFFDDALVGLEEYAGAIAKQYKIRLPEIPSGYCTWYSRPHGGASDETHMAELAEFCSKELTKYGFNLLQVDDKWQLSRRDFTSHNPKGPYPNGMKPTADKIRQAGMTAGIWFIPTGWDPNRPVFEGNQDWFVHKKDDGSIYTVHWAGSCLDMTHPKAREFLHEVVSRITGRWGFKYIKIDGLWTGMAVKILYPTPDYRDDNLGDAVLHNPAKTNIEAYRAGLKLVRKAAGDDVYILGCNIAQNMRTLGASIGLVDAMRIGRDIGARWKSILNCAEMGTRLYFMHNRLWHNDPDCLLLREPLSLDQARAWGSWIAISGQLNIVSEWLPGLPDDRLDIIKRSMPNHGLCGRPIDLFENNPAKLWHLTEGTEQQRKDIIGIFNWDDKNPDTVRIQLASLSLPDSADGAYVGFDYWENKFVGPFAGTLEVRLQPSSCRVISIRPLRKHPVIVSTSRHITQGMVDVVKQNWNSRRKTLCGTSMVVASDPYELRVFAQTDDEYRQIGSASVSNADKQAGVTIESKQTGPEIRITIKSPKNRLVSWEMSF